METLLKTVGRSLLVSSMIPAIAFVTVTMVIFAPHLPIDLLVWLKIDEPDFGGVLAFVLVTSFIAAYTLMILNWMLVRLYEGYYLPLPVARRIAKRQIKRHNQLAHDVRDSKKQLEGLKRDSDLYRRRWREYVERKGQLTAQFPDNVTDFLPSRLGNIYRAFEDYPFVRYGMHGVFFWPRLAKVIPADYAAKLEELNNAVAFLLASSLISVLIGVEVIIALISMETLDLRVFIPLACFVLSRFFYHAATSTALTYGHYVRTCYDLFRLDLLAALRIEPPANPDDEKELWRRVHEFLVLGEDSPYRRRAPAHSPSMLLCTAGQLIQTWVALIFWSGFSRALKWISAPVGNSQMNIIPVRAGEG